MLFLLIRVINGGYFFGLLYIFVLSGFIAAAKQDDNFFSGILVIHPVAGAIVNTHFGDAFSHRLHIARIPPLEALNPGVDAVSGPLIPKVPDPLFIDAGFAYRHGLSVVYRQQIVKGIFKEIFDCLPSYFLTGAFLERPLPTGPAREGGA
jgi:hypothetical protein